MTNVLDIIKNTSSAILFETDKVVVIFYEELQIGHIRWKGNPNLEEYKIPFMTLLNHAKAGHTITKFLTDTREQGVVGPETRKWLTSELFPACVEEGLQRVAAVSNANVFKKYYVNNVLNSVNTFGIPIKVVNDEKSAFEFLVND